MAFRFGCGMGAGFSCDYRVMAKPKNWFAETQLGSIRVGAAQYALRA